jgi:hypothetical protein
MKTRLFAVLTAITAVLSLISCPQPTDSPAVYSVTVSQSAGGTVSASPEKGPAGTIVTLSNSPEMGYAFSHYLLDGETYTAGSVTLTKNITLSGLFNPALADKTALREAIAGAARLRDETTVSVNDQASGAAQGVKYVTQAQKDALTSAINTAQGVYDSEKTTQPQADAALVALNKAVTAFTAQRDSQTGTNANLADMTALNAAIAEANAAKAGVKVSDTAAAVDEGVPYVTAAQMDTFTAAIDAARAVTSSAAQEMVTAATETLAEATAIFKGYLNSQIGTGLDAAKAALQTLIDAIPTTIAQAGVVINTAAGNVPVGTKWVTQAEWNTLQNARTAAQTAYAESATAGAVNAAKDVLQTALDAFSAAKKEGTLRTAEAARADLDAKITAAQNARNSTAEAANANEVFAGTHWVTPEAMSAFTAAISAAETARNATGATAESLDSAAALLDTAIAAFTAAKQPGTSTAKTDLLDLIHSVPATIAQAGVVINTAAGNVPVGTAWVTQAEWNALQNARTAAQAAYDTLTTVTEALAAKDTLQAAIAAFTAAKKTGTKLGEAIRWNNDNNARIIDTGAASVTVTFTWQGQVTPWTEDAGLVSGKTVKVVVNKGTGENECFPIEQALDIRSRLADAGAADISIEMGGTGADTMVPLWNGEQIRTAIFEKTATTYAGKVDVADWPIDGVMLKKALNNDLYMPEEEYYLNFTGNSDRKVRFASIVIDYYTYIFNGGFKLKEGGNNVTADVSSLESISAVEVYQDKFVIFNGFLDIMNQLGLTYEDEAHSKIINFDLELYPSYGVSVVNLYDYPLIIRMVEWHMAKGAQGRAALGRGEYMDDIEIEDIIIHDILRLGDGLMFARSDQWTVREFKLDSGVVPYSGNVPVTSGGFTISTDAALWFKVKNVGVSNFIAVGDAYTNRESPASFFDARKGSVFRNAVFKGSLKGVQLYYFYGVCYFDNHLPDAVEAHFNDDPFVFGNANAIVLGPNSYTTADTIPVGSVGLIYVQGTTTTITDKLDNAFNHTLWLDTKTSYNKPYNYRNIFVYVLAIRQNGKMMIMPEQFVNNPHSIYVSFWLDLYDFHIDPSKTLAEMAAAMMANGTYLPSAELTALFADGYVYSALTDANLQ